MLFVGKRSPSYIHNFKKFIAQLNSKKKLGKMIIKSFMYMYIVGTGKVSSIYNYTCTL